MNRAAHSLALISEGRCWDCETQLAIAEDGWADCGRCGKRMRITGGRVFERHPVDVAMLGRPVSLGDVWAIGHDGAPCVIDISIGGGEGIIPPHARWLEMSWPITAARR